MSNENALATFKGLSTLLRPRYTRGLLLEDDDLTAAVEYTRNSVRLLFRSLFGCGVICGLVVVPVITCNSRQLKVTVKKGVALDCRGNPIEIPREQTLTFTADCEPLPPHVWVSVCYLEKNCRPKDVSCSSDEDSTVVQTRSHDGFEIKLYKQQPACACACGSPTAPANGAQTRASSTCCNESASSGQTQLSTDPCDCYTKHDEGNCDCDCDCSCVLIARIDIGENASYDDGTTLTPDTKVRRNIRPKLLGQEKCKPAVQSGLPAQGEVRTPADRVVVSATPVAAVKAETKAETKTDVKPETKVESKAKPKTRE